MLVLEENARLILTDSGGMQKEAYFFGVPCITLRPETEWIETVEVGWNCVSGSSRNEIIEAFIRFTQERPQAAKADQVFGNGKAGEK